MHVMSFYDFVSRLWWGCSLKLCVFCEENVGHIHFEHVYIHQISINFVAVILATRVLVFFKKELVTDLFLLLLFTDMTFSKYS